MHFLSVISINSFIQINLLKFGNNWVEITTFIIGMGFLNILIFKRQYLTCSSKGRFPVIRMDVSTHTHVLTHTHTHIGEGGTERRKRYGKGRERICKVKVYFIPWANYLLVQIQSSIMK